MVGRRFHIDHTVLTDTGANDIFLDNTGPA